MADIDPRVFEEMNRYLEVIAHSLSSPDGAAPRGRVKARAPASTYYRNTGLLSGALERVTGTFKLMHGSADDFVHSLGRVTRGLVGLEVLHLAVRAAIDFGKTYSKLTDIGQTFGGSMFEMARQAGESGLSLDEFAKMLARNSVAAAALSSRSKGTANSMGQLQLAVRTNLEGMGFYGMTLSELTDQTSDYAETMRVTGGLDRTNNQQRAQTMSQLIADVSKFSEATGKSRQEILKTMNATARETSSAMRMAAENLGQGQREAFNTFNAFFSSLPGVAGEQLPKFFAQLYGTGGNAWFTDFGKTLIKSGLGDLTPMMGRMVGSMQGSVANIDEMVDQTFDMRDSILSRQKTLQVLANAGNQEAAHALQFAQSLLGLDREELKDKMKQQKAMEEFTKEVMLFEHNFHLLTGRFRDGFYQSFGSIIKGLSGAKTKEGTPLWEFLYGKRTDKGIEGGVLNKLGLAFGTLVGRILSPENLEYIGRELNKFAEWLTAISSDEDFKNAIISFEQVIVSIVETIGWALGKLHDILTGTGLSSGAATIIEALMILYSKTLIKWVARLIGLTARTLAPEAVTIASRVAGYGLGGPAAALGGAAAAGGGVAATGGFIGGTARATSWLNKAGGRGLTGLVIGAGVDFLAHQMIDAVVPEGEMKRQVTSVVDAMLTGAVLGGAVGGVPGAIVGALAGGIGAFVLNNMPDDATTRSFVQPEIDALTKKQTSQLSGLNEQLIEAQQKLGQDVFDPAAMSDDMDRIARLLETIAILTSQGNKDLKDLKDVQSRLDMLTSSPF